MPTFGQETHAALEALQTGGDIDQAVESTRVETQEPALSEALSEQTEETEETIEESSQEVVDETDASEVSEESESVVESITESDESVEEVKVNGRKVKVDWNDREKLKKYIQAAGGMRKFQAERDQVRQEFSSYKDEVREDLELSQSIQQAFGSGGMEGVEGIINLLSDDDNAFSSAMESWYDKRRMKEDASPAELERIELQEQLERERKFNERIRKEQEESKSRREQEDEAREVAKLESLTTPAFRMYSYDGKLNNEALESKVNKMIWNDAIAALKEVPEDVELTKTIVNREFRKAALSFRTLVESESKKTVSKVIKDKKAQAASKAAVAASKGPQSMETETAVKDSIKKGNLREALANFLK